MLAAVGKFEVHLHKFSENLFSLNLDLNKYPVQKKSKCPGGIPKTDCKKRYLLRTYKDSNK